MDQILNEHSIQQHAFNAESCFEHYVPVWLFIAVNVAASALMSPCCYIYPPEAHRSYVGARSRTATMLTFWKWVTLSLLGTNTLVSKGKCLRLHTCHICFTVACMFTLLVLPLWNHLLTTELDCMQSNVRIQWLLLPWLHHWKYFIISNNALRLKLVITFV